LVFSFTFRGSRRQRNSEGLSNGLAEIFSQEFLAAFASFNRITGLNWWHFGGGKSISHRMLEAIIKARLGTKTTNERATKWPGAVCSGPFDRLPYQ
jgi:hypothetical protein